MHSDEGGSININMQRASVAAVASQCQRKQTTPVEQQHQAATATDAVWPLRLHPDPSPITRTL